LATGLGAATADGAYGAVAAFGLVAISNFLVSQRFWLGFLGGILLCYLGARTCLSQPIAKDSAASAGSLFSAWLATFFLTLTNPMTILSFIAVFAGFGLAASPDYSSAGLMVAGVFLGSAAWWVILSCSVAALRSSLNPGAMKLVNLLSGVIILAFGLFAILKVLL
jgi:threonine/homoserine/homoserine lactone efflux protein